MLSSKFECFRLIENGLLFDGRMDKRVKAISINFLHLFLQQANACIIVQCSSSENLINAYVISIYTDDFV